jgi:hypothetical protein
MKAFLEHLTEAVKSSGSKNVHLEHLEDEIINSGYSGFRAAANSILGLVDTLRASAPAAYDLTVKWDGAPAIVCGIDPVSGRFFVGTKSVFNVTPKLNFTPADIDENHPAAGLNEKLKLALKYLSKLGITGILQGDFLFDAKNRKTETIDGKRYLTFQANTITYAVPADSKLAARMRTAKMGIVFHTAYEGDTIQTVSTRFNPDLSGLRRTRDVWFDNATMRMVNGSSLFTDHDRSSIASALMDLERKAKDLSGLFKTLAADEGLRVQLKTYINGLVRIGKTNGDADEFARFVQERAVAKRKKPSGKTVPTYEKIRKNRNQFNRMFALHNALGKLKMVVLDKLKTIESEVSTFVRQGKGYRVTTPEGFVAIDRMTNNAIKLVDRLDFSRTNFTLQKDWGKQPV